MSYTSINISNSDNNFKYIIEYIKDDFNKIGGYSYISSEDQVHIFNDDLDQVYKNNSVVSVKTNPLINTHMPTKAINTSKINIYFPEFSVDTYERGVKYILTVNTWINNKIIYLGSFIINRQDCVAADKIRSFYNEKYYEMLSFEIIDPFDLIFDDKFKDFRVNECGSIVSGGVELNNNSSILNFTFHPITEVDGGGSEYVLLENYIGGQNAINLKEGVSNNLRNSIEVKYDKEIQLYSKLYFNSTYDDNWKGLLEYINETYNTAASKLDILFDFYYVQDDMGVCEYFYGYSNQYDSLVPSNPVADDLVDCTISKDDLNIGADSWENYYIPGMYIICSATIKANDVELLTIMSNKVLITPEVFKYAINTDINGTPINYIELKKINMNDINLNVVNKHINNVIQLDRPKDYKSNIIKPVYYRTRDLNNLVIHPNITENICLNLDKYKYTVDSFILRLEGINFAEISRNPNGVIFKVVGNKLPNTIQNGTYYILNQDSELVSYGKYIYEL